MSRISMSGLAALALISCLCLIGGCKDTTAPAPAPDPSKTFRPLTDKADVITNLVLSYTKADITHYEELLHPDYTFYLQAWDVTNGKEFFTRTEDVNIQTEMFKATRGQATTPALNLDRLELSLTGGSWTPVDSIDGAPCVDCWKTTREYTMTLIFTGGLNGYTGNDQTEFIIVPVIEGGKKLYKLWRQTDINGF
jgi:hypothetical protein